MEKTEGTKKELSSALEMEFVRHLHEQMLARRCKKVKDIMSQDVQTIAPEASMAQAADVMGEKHIGSLIVVKYGTPVGIVTERDLLSKVLALDKDLRGEKVEQMMSFPLEAIRPLDNIREAAQAMTQSKGRLAVFDGRKLVGVVTASDLIKSFPVAPETAVKICDFMTRQAETVDEKTHVSDVVKIMGEKRIGSVIVTSRSEPFGIFTERDLLTTVLIKGKPLISEVGIEATSPLITGTADMSVHKAAAIMSLKHIRRMPIVENKKLVGIITARDLVEAYAK